MTKKLTRGMEKRKQGRPIIPEEEKTKYVRLLLQMPEDIHKELKGVAKKTKRSVTGYIVYAVEKAIEGDK